MTSRRTLVRIAVYATLGAIVIATWMRLKWTQSSAAPDSSARVTETIDDVLAREVQHTSAKLVLSLGTPVYTLGLNPASDAEEFAGIKDGILLPTGVAVISDALKHRLVIISPSGDNVTVNGRAGEGPGEFRELLATFTDSIGRVYVLDNGLHRVSVFSLAAGELSYQHAYMMVGEPYTSCVFQEGFISLEYRPINQRLLHRINNNGKLIESFLPPLVSGSHRLNDAVTKGRLICDSARGRILVAAVTGDVMAVDATGKLLWRIGIPEYRPSEIVEIGSGVVRHITAPAPENRSNALGRFVLLNDSLAVIQLLVFERWSDNGKDKVGQTAVDTRIIDIRNGAEVGRQLDLPEFLAISGNVALITGDEPVPWIALHSFRVIPIP